MRRSPNWRGSAGRSPRGSGSAPCRSFLARRRWCSTRHPRRLVDIAGASLPDRYRRALRRFRYGPGVCKIDWALSGPVPWSAEVCRRAGTVHLGGTFAEVEASEADVNAGRHPDRPYCIVVQAGVTDPGRAPAGQQALWGYCHVPSGSDVDMTAAVEAQIERFAPGFSDLVVARSVLAAADEERHNPNYVGGDIAGGASSLDPDRVPPNGPVEPVPDAARGRLPVLGIHRAGWRSARDVRGVRGADRAARSLRRSGTSPRLRRLRPPGPPGSVRVGGGWRRRGSTRRRRRCRDWTARCSGPGRLPARCRRRPLKPRTPRIRPDWPG